MYEVNLERYYNRFVDNPQYADYKQILFRAGDTLQSAELNELQITLKNDIGAIANRFIGNGDFISGGEIEVHGVLTGDVDGFDRPTYDWTINSKEGVFFAEGEFSAVPASSIQKLAIAKEEANFIVGVLVHYDIVLEGEDTSLLDPAQGTRNFGQPGAGRLRITSSIQFDDVPQDNDNQFFGKYVIENGVLVVEKMTDAEFTKRVLNIVSEYDREANGNYVVEDMKVKFTHSDSFLGRFHFQIGEGKANVAGYKFTKGFTTNFHLTELVDFDLRQSEPTTFTVNGNYAVRHSPVRKVFRISGDKNETLNITHGESQGVDHFPASFGTILNIVSITQGPTTYTETADFTLDNDTINWGPAGAEPAVGSTYTVEFDYRYVENEPNFIGGNGDINAEKDGINLIGFNAGSSVLIDYDFVLPRVDTIIMNSFGQFKYVHGVAREFDALPPRINTDNNLPIADVILLGDSDPQVKQTGQRVFEMSDIEKLYEDIRANEYNIGKMSLQMDLSERGMDLKNSFVENFSNDDQRDTGYESAGGYIPAIAVSGELTFNIDWTTSAARIGASENISLFPDFKEELRLQTVGSTSAYEQPHYTKVRKINEFMFIPAPRATLRVTPSVYRWIDRRIFVDLVRDVESKNYLSKLVGTGRMYTWQGRYASWWDHHMRKSSSRRTISRTSSIDRSSVPAIIPTIPLRLTSKVADFNNNESVEILWNNKVIETAQSNGSGQLNTTFNVPVNEISGRKRIGVKGVASGVEGETSFLAQPLTLTTTTVTTRYWKWVRKGDPVAQSFTFETDTVIDGIKVWFGKAPTTNTILQIVELTAGMPDISKMVTNMEVPVGTITDDSAYKFVLSDKITAIAGKSYAFIVGCDDAVGEVKVARLGERTIDEGKWLTSQADTSGVMFNSSNGETWSPIQKEDMMFEIFSTTFESSREFTYDQISVNDVSDLMLMTDASVTTGNSIKYKLLLDDTYPVQEIAVDAHRQYRIGHKYTGNVTVKAEMMSDGKFSPTLSPDIQLASGLTAVSSTYTSTAFKFDSDDVKIVCYVDVLQETGTTYKLQVQVLQSGTWNWIDLLVQDGENIGDGWREEKYEIDLTTNVPDQSQDVTRVRVQLTSNEPTQKMFMSNLRLNNLSQ